MSTSSTRYSGLALIVLGVALALVVVAQRSTATWFIGAVTILTAVIGTTRGKEGTSLLVATGLVGPIAMVAISPPRTTAHLLLLVPLGVFDLIGFLLASSPEPLRSTLGPLEWSFLLGASIVSALVVVVALVTPLTNLVGHLISGILILAVLVILYRLVPEARQHPPR
ncbi:MAG: hypothetical protein ACP5HZ_04195 [Ferrimicrobium sp.]|uniref:hypothetical protein n=1 Tax=Ferrimicrobium sp. TaxID=2926050 RepID=UPI002617FF70|nr:hypothetical protein [Ferrimicrobium sp.]